MMNSQSKQSMTTTTMMMTPYSMMMTPYCSMMMSAHSDTARFWMIDHTNTEWTGYSVNSALSDDVPIDSTTKWNDVRRRALSH